MNRAGLGKRFARRGAVLGFILPIALAAAPAVAQTALEKAKRDELFHAKEGDPAMERAFAKARETLDGFLKAASDRAPGADGFAVKIALREGSQTEFVWISPFRVEGDKFAGRLNNTPRLVTSYRSGQEVSFARAQIADWLYIENGRMKGNFTACPLLAKSPPAEQEAFKKRFGLSCDF